MSTTKKIAGAALAAALGVTTLSACGGDAKDKTAGASDAPKSTTVTLVSHDSFNVTDAVLKEFEQQSGYTVKTLKAGDAGAALNQEILTKGSPRGDVFFGVDNTLLSRALDNGIFTPYEAKGLAGVKPEYVLDKEHRVTPIDSGDICVNYDKAYFAEKKIAPPQTLDDLVKPEYKNLLVTENAATSSPGLGFLLASVGKYGEEGWKDYWSKLKANGVEVVDGWEQAYNERFSGSMRRQEGQGRPPAGRLLRLQPSGRGAVRRAAAGRGPHGRLHRHLLPADRVRGPAQGRQERGGRQGPRGLPDQQEVPGGHASPDVREPRDEGRRPAGAVHQARCGDREARERGSRDHRQEP